MPQDRTCPKPPEGLLEELPDLVFTLGPEGHITFVNQPGLRLLGHAAEDILGKHYLELVHPEDRESALAAFRRTIAKRNPRPRENRARLLKADSTSLWVATLLVFTFDEEGRLLRALGISRDISYRLRAEEAFLRSEKKFRNIVESIPLGIYIYRLEPDGRLVFSGANPAADAIIGIDHRQLYGKTLEEAFPPLANTEIPEQYRRVGATGEPWHSDQVNYDFGEIKGTYEVHAFQTEPETLAVAFLDITNRRAMEEALRDR